MSSVPRSSPPVPRPARPLGRPRPVLWFRATRPVYVLTSLIPALAGALVAVGRDGTRWGLLPVALVALALVHAATNACNDVEDAARGLDSPDKLNNSGIFNTGILSLREGRILYAALFGTAVVLGLILAALQGVAVLVIGVLGVLGGWLYTGGPRPYKYVGLGDPLIVGLMGPLLTLGAYTAVTGEGFAAAPFWLGLGPGLLIAAVLAANNTADLEEDGAAGLRTLAVRLGFARARLLYVGVLVGGLLVPVALWAAGLFGPWILVALAPAPLALACARQALSARSGGGFAALETLVPRTAQVHLTSSALLCAGVLADRL